MSSTQVLVTGATGFIGRHLVDRLTDAGVSVVALARPHSRLPDRWSGRVAATVVEELSEGFIRSAFRRCTIGVVYHQAAYGVRSQDRDEAMMLRVNVELPSTLVRLAKDWGAAVIATGSCAEYARPTEAVPVDEHAPLETGKLYGGAKAAGGLLASAVATEIGVPFRYLRLFNVYGPGEAAHRLLPSLVARLRSGKRVALSEGTQIRDFVLVDDAVDALMDAGRQAQSGEGPKSAIWNVCSGQGHSVRAFATAVAQALDKPLELCGFGDLAMRKDEVPWLVGNGGLIARELGWRPRHSFETGVAEAALRLAAQQAELAHA